MSSTTSTDPVTRSDAFQLSQARIHLKEIAQQAQKEAHKEGSPAFNLGQLHEACEVASTAIFNALNTAKSMLDSENAAEFLHVGN